MPVEGSVANEYGRVYRYIKPNGTNPGTYRLSVPETGTGGGAGGGAGETHNIVSVEPIQSTTLGTTDKTTTITFDIQSLTSRV